ncbi:hypothetical protein E4U48_008275 [Claviceps purpurea]|nr:hypothetical protein E4U37_002997 [Claviceps purpurea]KAG6260557.1 hypothetical protein E4U48_008275 [Claviceps purpurea]KAG6261216.1 hypothetical protein E4U49_004132 [Claviceps purpurea]KAG6317975.1 hypothetical protein E4U44_008271 [Claviceps purpurea]
MDTCGWLEPGGHGVLLKCNACGKRTIDKLLLFFKDNMRLIRHLSIATPKLKVYTRHGNRPSSQLFVHQDSYRNLDTGECQLPSDLLIP